MRTAYTCSPVEALLLRRTVQPSHCSRGHLLQHTVQLTKPIRAPLAVQVYLQTAPGAEEGWTANFSSMMTKLLQESYDGSKVQRDAQQRTEALATLAEVPGLPPLPDLPPKVR